MTARLQKIETDGLQSRQSLEATLHPSCSHCGAPPRYLSAESIRVGWPGCYVPPGDLRDGRYLHDLSTYDGRCPNCTALRGSRGTPLGEVWAREVWATPPVGQDPQPIVALARHWRLVCAALLLVATLWEFLR